MQNFDLKIKNFLKEKMYFHNTVKTKTNYGKPVKVEKNNKIL